MKKFKEILSEALSDDEKKQVDQWANVTRSPEVQDAINNVFKGQHRIIIPFDLSNFESDPHPEVEHHLHEHGYSIKDYVAGIARHNETGTELGIGKVLNRTKAPDHIVSAYANDPVRKGTKQLNTKLQVVISHHPHDVAGMTSRGHSWYSESCMNFNDGKHRNYLPAEIRNGTHVAYLCHKGDDKAELPIARTAIKQFVDPDTNNIIFRTENKVYGKTDDLLKSIVHHWSQTNYPAVKGKEYEIKSGSYNDSGSDTYRERDINDLKDKIARGKFDGIGHYINHDYVLGKDITDHVYRIAKNEISDTGKSNTLLNFWENSIKSRQMKIPCDVRTLNATARLLYDHVVNAKNIDEKMRAKIVHEAFSRRYGDVYDTDNLNKTVSIKNHLHGSTTHETFLKNSKVTDKLIEDASPYDYHLIDDRKLKDHHIDKLFNESGLQTIGITDTSNANTLIHRITKPEHFQIFIPNSPSAHWHKNKTYRDSPELQKLYFDSNTSAEINIDNVGAKSIDDSKKMRKLAIGYTLNDILDRDKRSVGMFNPDDLPKHILHEHISNVVSDDFKHGFSSFDIPKTAKEEDLPPDLASKIVNEHMKGKVLEVSHAPNHFMDKLYAAHVDSIRNALNNSGDHSGISWEFNKLYKTMTSYADEVNSDAKKVGERNANEYIDSTRKHINAARELINKHIDRTPADHPDFGMYHLISKKLGDRSVELYNLKSSHKD